MAKYYAVAKGRSGESNIYTSWDECKADVIGFKGAVYKSFGALVEAENYLKLHSGSGKDLSGCADESDSILKIYVDGSYNHNKKQFSYGLAAVKCSEVIFKDKGKGEDQEAVALRNVAGEVLGAMKAVDFAINNDYKDIAIYFDYQGIESWALGTWKRNNKITENYHLFMQEKMKEIKIKFIKVKGHSGDKFNDLADKLAKAALDD
ncbi:viroplasmin family protein [Clostridium polynesiense]|uniref:ribonuclease H1 domain-containing protein n=1 Tax=Clostridium polynesiense TaxID=1325933 RepID=UPI00058D532E|nr:ribonuclease H family protein [Clostridium polynesiense]